MKASTNVQRIAEMVATFARQERIAIEGANKARAELKRKVKRMKRPRSSCPSCSRFWKTNATIQLKKWERARDFLAPFVAEGKTEELVVSADGTNFSNDGGEMVLRKATVVYVCALRAASLWRTEGRMHGRCVPIVCSTRSDVTEDGATLPGGALRAWRVPRI